MANRWFNQFQKTLEKEVCALFAKVTFGSTGAPTLSVANSKGIVSVTRNSAGVYTFVFGTSAASKDTYYKLLMAKHVFLNATAPASPGMYIVANNVAAAAASIQLTFNSAGTATDPGSGEVVFLQFLMGNSSAY